MTPHPRPENVCDFLRLSPEDEEVFLAEVAAREWDYLVENGDEVMRPELVEQMRSFNIPAGDRGDPVAVLCRRLFLRVGCCPCLQRPPCLMCENDMDAVEDAWDTTQGWFPPEGVDDI